MLGEMFKVNVIGLYFCAIRQSFCGGASRHIYYVRELFLFTLIQSFDGGSKQMLNGTMVHEVFQRAATAKDFSLQKLSQLAEEALCSPRYLGDM